jgi:uncharacterized protein YceK
MQMPMKIIKLLVIIVIIALFVNSGTVRAILMHEKGDPIIYGGVRTNLQNIKSDNPHNIFHGPLIKTLLIIDLPFSFLFDTVLLPATVLWSLYDIYFDKYNLIYYTILSDRNMLEKTLHQPFMNINYTDKYKRNALHYAVCNENIDIIKFLISIKINLNQADINNETPIFKAIDLCNADIVKLLIVNGVDINIKNNAGETPLEKAYLKRKIFLKDEEEYKRRLKEKKNIGNNSYELAGYEISKKKRISYDLIIQEIERK